MRKALSPDGATFANADGLAPVGGDDARLRLIDSGHLPGLRLY